MRTRSNMVFSLTQNIKALQKKRPILNVKSIKKPLLYLYDLEKLIELRSKVVSLQKLKNSNCVTSEFLNFIIIQGQINT